ncbi:aromatic compound degradation protein PaaI [Streptomyces abyssalis]|uniref:Aromatic compound degradation protein PaaI n=1 Tax=Streptomyces abyssalis TaxID=933944 RepID=A0A1E7JSC2_9ACTN|nr:PaaI family thioesterase [Streptomyces abyssalis]OEU91793.1 aromatic compound degradation protein PaaI [Streptomyces abyssalis]OEU94068.1 aromatic compound degradation protein PaaI [Streptomyces abyssalis]OEV26616.1 aromatic compound degradation protein PaaI [Streptomyces nanshensis]
MTDPAGDTPVPTLAQIAALMPFAQRLGIRIEAATPEEVAATLPWAEDLCTAGGVLHGGALMSLADSVGAVCAFLNLPPGAGTTTVESKTNFLRGVRSGQVRAVARPLHVGRTLIVVETSLWDEKERRVGQTTQSQLVTPPPSGA